MLIEGFGIAGYRSFGSELQKIGPCSKINLLVGQNNSGKSNVLRFLEEQYKKVVEAIMSGGSFSFQGLDRHEGTQAAEAVALSLPLGGENFKALENSLPEGRLRDFLKLILQCDCLTQGDSAAWFIFRQADRAFRLDPKLVQLLKQQAGLSQQDWGNLWRAFTGRSSGDFETNWFPETLAHIRSAILKTPPVTLIPAIRQISEGSAKDSDFSGAGLIQRLAKLQHPSLTQRHLRQRFENINRFLQNVVGEAEATLEIPDERDMILVHMNNRTLPLSSLGTGIHEVTILAAAATALTDRVVCIEEPELHLHPLLQKKLVRYLQDKTENQYFLTTHSAHLLDTPGAAIFHVRLQGGATTIECVESSSAKSQVCVDLGYRASDLLQANCVIWVEGPSDRIYLKHWIKAADPKLVEGVHYSIMFYGGRLLSHLTANDPEVEDFISLRRLNRFISIVIDSDRSSTHGPLNATKRRVRDEFDEGPGFAWITKGREIENYIPEQQLQAAIKAVHQDVDRFISMGQFGKLLDFKRRAGRTVHTADKVKVAHEVVKRPADLGRFDLKKMIDKSIAFIHEANDVEGY